MAEYDNNLRGRLFKNDRKERENQPDYTGDCEVEGQKYRLAGWMKKSQAGQPYMSLSLSIPQPQGNPSAPPPVQTAATNQSMDDEIPF